jgi:hypothetical protein
MRCLIGILLRNLILKNQYSLLQTSVSLPGVRQEELSNHLSFYIIVFK